MDDAMKMLLEQKKMQLKIKLQRAEIQQYIEYFERNIEQFAQKYRYADETEIIKIEKFISKLDFARPGQLAVKEVCPYCHRNVYLCFLTGTEALFKIYIFGKYDDIMDDYDEWEVLSPYLLLVDEDFCHYVYMNDDGDIMESQVM